MKSGSSSGARTSLRNLNPVFHKTNKSDDNDAVPAGLLKQARKCGTLNLSGRGIASVPDKVFALNDPDKSSSITLESLTVKDDEAWWNQKELITLDLSSNRLIELSPKISHLNSLTTLMLYDNGLTTLPKEIAKLEKLSRLNLSRNKLKELPDDFYTLPELRYLNLSHNCFEELHPSISDLHMLEILDASNNNIETVPCGIGFLVRVTELYLSHNRIKELPPDIVNMRCLKKLDLMYNDISELPQDIGSLRKLQCLYLQHNNITDLPTFEGCQELQELHISDNFIQRIPSRLCVYLTHLKIFDIRDNKITNLPEEIAFLKTLTRLDISNNSISQLPTSLCSLPHLASLQIDGNTIKTIRRDIIQCGTSRILQTLRERSAADGVTTERIRTGSNSSDEVILNMPGDGLNSPRNVQTDNAGEDSIYPNKYSMRQTHSLNLAMRNLADVPDDVFESAAAEYVNCVDFSKNQLRTLPKGLLALSKCATELVFANNAISEVPTFVSQFKHVSLINLSRNMLKDLPKEFGLLNTLRELNISNNRFEHIPSCVYDLNALEILLARDNRITTIDATSQGLGALKRLATLDLGNNNIEQVPPILGKLENITVLELIGNPFRQPRHQILQKGTYEIMAYLRSRIPQ